MTEDFIYEINTAQVTEIQLHLELCDAYFTPPLSQRVEISAYSTKIHENATLFEAWHENELVGLIAMYSSDINNSGFITNVSVIPRWGKKGIATKLLHQCLSFASKFDYDFVTLEVSNSNAVATAFYLKNGFTIAKQDGDVLNMNYSFNKN